MGTEIVCPNCGQTYTITAEQAPQYAGQTISCTRCGKPFVVNLSSGAVPPPIEQPGVQAIGYQVPGQYGEQGPASRMAIAALVLACLGLVLPIIGIVGLVLGIVALVKIREPQTRGKGLAIAGIAVGGVSIVTSLVISTCLLGAFLSPSLGRARETANRVKCASNMRQIGQAMLLYSNDNRGQYPPTPDLLLVTQDITPEVFVCASSNDEKADAGSGTVELIANFHKPGHNSYVYMGAGQNNACSAEVILLYEVPTNHDGDGSNFLYGDGHVEFQNKNMTQAIINELTAGHNPPRSSVLKGIR